MKKYLLVISGAVAVLVLTLLVRNNFASAQTSTDSTTTSGATSTLKNVPELRRVTIGRTGKIGMSGIVVSNNGTSGSTSSSSTGQIIVNSWGGDWTVNIGPTTTIRRQTTRSTIDPSEIMPGDRVEISGQTFRDQTLTIDASVIHDRSILRRTITGNISDLNTGNGTFTLTTSNGTEVTVTMPATGTPQVSGNGLGAFGDLEDGMTVKITGDVNYTQATVFAGTIVVTNLNGVSTTTSANNNPSSNTPTNVIPPLTTSSTTATPTSTVSSTSTNGGNQTNTTTTGVASTTPASVTVSIVNTTFSPSVITVQPGATVTWVNNDTVAHTVTADNGTFDSGVISPGSSFSRTFTQSASVAYHCSIHSNMRGMVNVQTGS